MFRSPGLSRIALRTPRRRAALLLCALFAAAAMVSAQQPAPDPAQQPAPAATPPTPTPDAAAPDQAAPSQAAPGQAAPVQAAPVQAAPDQAAPTQAPPAATPPVMPAPQASATEAAQLQPASTQQPGSTSSGAITEDELKQQLVGKQFYLRGGFLGDSLAFDEHGKITGHSPQGSYTLSVIQIDRVRLTKHKVDLEGARFGLHFNEQLAYEDSSSAYDKVRITPKKKVVRISIDREMVVNPKKKKEPAKEKPKPVKPASAPTTAAAAQAQPTAPPANPAPSSNGPGATPAAATAAVPSAPAPAADTAEPSEADQLKASIAATPEAERPADPNSVTTTTSQAHANHLLRDAIDNILAPGLDDRMRSAMPDFWKFYYQSVAAKADYRPADTSVLRQNTVDQKARLLSSFEPDSNDFAQTAGVAGMALYHTVIGPDGKPGEIAVARPIGFGLDENAVAAIRKAKFSPAIKNGQPVPVMLDLVVQFRIFSKRTGATGALPDLAQQAAPPPANPEQATTDKPADAAVLPGPYSVPHH